MGDDAVIWDEKAQIKFKQMLAKIPAVLQSIAEKKVALRAADLAKKEKRNVIGEKDLVDAFFAETPFGFHGPMKNDMQELGIDYIKYGYPA